VTGIDLVFECDGFRPRRPDSRSAPPRLAPWTDTPRLSGVRFFAMLCALANVMFRLYAEKTTGKRCFRPVSRGDAPMVLPPASRPPLLCCQTSPHHHAPPPTWIVSAGTRVTPLIYGPAARQGDRPEVEKDRATPLHNPPPPLPSKTRVGKTPPPCPFPPRRPSRNNTKPLDPHSSAHWRPPTGFSSRALAKHKPRQPPPQLVSNESSLSITRASPAIDVFGGGR